ncbi:putative jasmonate O-methyltransferase [Helianthus annuus]|nr:putative jasmonate O-methyltransferase [Helianthus annuus]
MSVIKAYQRQFHEDFSLFLRSRAKEMASKGCMVLSFMGRRSPNPCADEAGYQWELLARALMSLALDVCFLSIHIYTYTDPYP